MSAETTSLQPTCYGTYRPEGHTPITHFDGTINQRPGATWAGSIHAMSDDLAELSEAYQALAEAHEKLIRSHTMAMRAVTGLVIALIIVGALALAG